MITEEQAQNKWCPFSRVIVTEKDENGFEVGHVVGNRATGIGTIPKNSKCVASKCMAWRWSEWVSRSGYCGIAGVQPD